MICKQLPMAQPQLAALALVAVSLISLGNFQAESEKRLTRKRPKIEIHLTGPNSLKANESLEIQQFRALLTNRSAEPLVFFVRNGYLMNALWNWTVTDDAGMPLGMEFVEHGYCGTDPYGPEAREAASRLHDSDLFVLAPGESREFPVQGAPSDDYVFPKAGTYHLSVSLLYVPPNATKYVDEYGKPQSAASFAAWKLGDLSVKSLETLQNSLSVQATSDIWNLRLPSSRHPEGSSLPSVLTIPPNLLKP